VPERRDDRHVLLPEMAARLDVDGHLPLVAAVAAIDPGQVHHGVHRLVRQFRGELGVGTVQRRKPGAEPEARRRAAQVIRQPFGQRRFVPARNRSSGAIIPAEPPAEEHAHPEQQASRGGGLAGQVAGRHDLEQRREVPGATVHGKSPDILQREIRRDLADPPGAGFVHCVRKPHRRFPDPYGIVWIVGTPACQRQYGAV